MAVLSVSAAAGSAKTIPAAPSAQVAIAYRTAKNANSG
jgi:hypothetical protein